MAETQASTIEPRPRVAVIGGFYDLDADAKAGRDARAYAEELGAALAAKGFGLVVYFSDDKSLEPHVVRGFVAGLPPEESAPCIDVRYSDAQRGQVAFAEQAARPKLFHEDPFPGPNWEAPFYRSLAARDSVDAAVFMAGGKSTLNAGQVAVGRGLPMLAIDKYAGTASTLRAELATRIPGYPSSQNANPSQLVGWLRDQHLREARRNQEEHERQLAFDRMTSQRRMIAWLGASLTILVITLGLGLLSVESPTVFLLVMGGALLAAGASGALVRGLLTTSIAMEPLLAGLLGALAGFVVGLAYLIPQLIGAPELLEPGAKAVDAADKIQFLSVTLVSITAGMGFDVIFRRTLQEAEKVPVGVGR